MRLLSVCVRFNRSVPLEIFISISLSPTFIHPPVLLTVHYSLMCPVCFLYPSVRHPFILFVCVLSVLSINAFQIIACLLFAVVTYAPLLVVLLFFSQSRWCHFNWTATDFFLSVVQPGGVTPAFKYVGWSSCHLNGARRATNQCRNHQISKITLKVK